MNKRKVQTLTIDKHDKIRTYLSGTPEGATPKMIALYTNITHSSVRGMIKKVDGVEQVPEVRGLYRLVHNSYHDGIFSYNFHNLLCVIYIPDYIGSKISKTLSSDLINTEFSIGAKSKQATMRISTPKVNGTDYPLNLSSITLAYFLFKELVLKHAGKEITTRDVEVRSIEFNKDYYNLKLEGINCITLENLIEQFKVYQKSDKLRIEHKLKIPFKADELFSILGIK